MKPGEIGLISADGSGRDFYFHDPAERFVGNGADVYLAARDAWRARGGWLAGCISADAAHIFDTAPRHENTDWPEIALFRYEHAPARSAAAMAGSETLSIITPAHPVSTREVVLAAIEDTRSLIAAGDIFQANLSQGFCGEAKGEDAPLEVCRRLIQSNPGPMAGYLCADPDRIVITHSPERFFRLDADGRAESLPIKGTRPRRPEPFSDIREAEALLSSEKDRAENVMIVDLMRNDFSRVCLPGSVRVPQLCELKSYRNVHHLVSRVTGRLRDGLDVFDLIGATFPPGSVTGAPKVRALEIIADLEGAPRGPYCGALGYVAPDGSADFNVMIRSVAFTRLLADRWRFAFRSGGGITIASEPEAEYQETLDKASSILEVLG